MKRKTPEEQYQDYLKSLLVKCRQFWSMRSPAKRKCVSSAHVKVDGFDKYLCASCSKYFSKSDIQCDHISPIKTTKPKNLEELIGCISRLECDLSGLQMLCKLCHAKKTVLDDEEFIAKRTSYIKNIEKFIEKKGYALPGLDDLNFKDLKKLQTIIDKISTSKKNRVKVWEDKARIFVEKHG